MPLSFIKQNPLAIRANVRVKGWLQEQAGHRGQAGYQRQAQKCQVTVPDDHTIQALLRYRLAGRRANRPPLPKGRLHIFLAYGLTNWERILPESLRPFGTVVEYEYRSRGFDDRAPGWLVRRDAMNRDMLAAFEQANRRCPIDAVVGYLSGNNTAPEVLTQMARAGAVIFNFCWDDKLHFPGHLRGGRYHSPAALAGAVDLNLTNAPGSVVKYAVHDGLALFWPEAAHPDRHRPIPGEFKYDVSFAGGRYGIRAELIDRLAAAGVKVACFGRGWPNGPISDDDLIALYSQSRVNLGLSTIAHTRNLCCLKARDFEVPMAGGLYLTQYHPDLDRVYAVGREIAAWRTFPDCIDCIRRLLADPEAAQAMRDAGRQRALRDHTYDRRWTQIFQLAHIMH